jgi:hypothetical protein
MRPSHSQHRCVEGIIEKAFNHWGNGCHSGPEVRLREVSCNSGRMTAHSEGAKLQFLEVGTSESV